MASLGGTAMSAWTQCAQAQAMSSPGNSRRRATSPTRSSGLLTHLMSQKKWLVNSAESAAAVIGQGCGGWWVLCGRWCGWAVRSMRVAKVAWWWWFCPGNHSPVCVSLVCRHTLIQLILQVFNKTNKIYTRQIFPDYKHGPGGHHQVRCVRIVLTMLTNRPLGPHQI